MQVYVDCQLIETPELRYSSTANWARRRGLKAYVDCQLVGTDVAGSPRLHVPTEFDQFANIFVGQCNDLPLNQNLPGVAVWKLTHADTVYTKTQCAALSGKCLA